jgi:hypothetical protein
MYEDYKIFGPYSRKDGRKHVIVVKGNFKKTISYPKFLVECYLNKELSKEETIDHIDGDFNNNDFSNLRIVNRSQHSKYDSIKLIPLETKCPICGKKVLINSTNSYNRGKVAGFCSKKCGGVYGKMVQMGYIKPINQELDFKYQKSKLSALSEMVTVEDLKFGEGLTNKVDANTEPSPEMGRCRD